MDHFRHTKKRSLYQELIIRQFPPEGWQGVPEVKLFPLRGGKSAIKRRYVFSGGPLAYSGIGGPLDGSKICDLIDLLEIADPTVLQIAPWKEVVLLNSSSALP